MDILKTFLNVSIKNYIIYQIMYSIKYVPFKDIKGFISDPKKVYKFVTEEFALSPLNILKNKLNNKYINIIDSWYIN